MTVVGANKTMTDDRTLLRRYVDDKDVEAFDELVNRHYSMVHRTAFLRTRDITMADDVTVEVFTLLSQRASSLGRGVIIAGWLFKAAHLSSRNAMKQDNRRRLIEQAAIAELREQLTSISPEIPVETASMLEDGLLTLTDFDRNAVLLRYVQGLSLADTAVELGVSAEAARKRSERGIKKMRLFCANHGLAFSTAFICAAILQPKADAEIGCAFVSNVIAHQSNSQITCMAKGANRVMAMSNAKTIAAIAATIVMLVGSGGYAVYHSRVSAAGQIGDRASRQSIVVKIAGAELLGRYADSASDPNASAEEIKKITQAVLDNVNNGRYADAIHLLDAGGESYSPELVNIITSNYSSMRYAGGPNYKIIGSPVKASEHVWEVPFRWQVMRDCNVQSYQNGKVSGIVKIKAGVLFTQKLSLRNDNPKKKWVITSGL
jgi:RNA polymerase sigma-70 factor (ECF subfamily)